MVLDEYLFELHVHSICFSFQEVLLKRAADLVEALYGMPHNNQVCSVFSMFEFLNNK